jgi:glycosyltransferase involved in cell wall biosynthesis
LLVICDAYRSFQKDPIDCVSSKFNNIFVFVRYNPISEISNYIHIPSLEVHRLSSKIDLTNKPSNISLYPTPILYLPTDSQYKKMGEKHVEIVEKNIKRNNIKFDLIHTHFTWSAGYAGAKLKERYDLPFIVTAHGYDVYNLPFKDNSWRSNIEYVLNSADVIITVSNSNYDHIKKLDVHTPVKIIPNGYKEDLFYPRDLSECRKILNLPIDQKIILSVGNLEEVKGHRYLIEAISHIVKERKDVICCILGGGRLEAQLKKCIFSAKLQDHIRLIGSKPHHEIPLWMNACDVFVLPSLNEGNPTVMFECLGCGKPFIGTKVGGIPEIIISNDYGLLVEPGNTKDLIEKIEISLNKKWDEKKIASYAEKYRWKEIAKQIQQIYCHLLQN